MKINLQESFQLIKDAQPGLTLFQFEKYWNWYLELQTFQHPYLATTQIFSQWLSECQSGKPIGHILGQWGFFQDIFFVNEATLIPRPETEIMVERALKIIDRPMRVLEIGVGSGAILLSVMLHAKFKLICTGTDISHSALQLCQKNYAAKSLRLAQHEFKSICTDRTLGLDQETFDLILCNPPYIPENHPGVSPQVHLHEPSLALYLPVAEYDKWMRELIDGIIKCLKPGGIALIEGHEEKLHNLHKIIIPKFSSTLINDLNQLPRFLHIQKPTR